MKVKTLFLFIFLITGAMQVPVSAQTNARFYTTHGNFDVVLRDDLVPITANNFIDLVDTLYYDGVIWHRVVANFVIQSGDPTGTGNGGPGYTIPDEFHPALRHYKKGILSMANAGPNTGGSQFFITLKQVLYLDSLHSVFGEVTSGMEAVDSIAAVPVDANDRPLNPPVIDSIRILAPTFRDPEIRERSVLLGGNFPNPFSEQTTFTFGLREAAAVEFSIFDAQGRLLRKLRAGHFGPGDHQIRWDGCDENGKPVSSGLYFYQIRANGETASKPMLKQ